MASTRTTVTTPLAWTLGEHSGDSLFVPTSVSEDLSAPRAYNHTNSLWTSYLGTAQTQRLVLPVTADKASVAMLKFIGSPESMSEPVIPEGEFKVYLGRGALWGVSRIERPEFSDEYVGEFLGLCDLTVGADGIGTSGILPTAGDTAFVRRATVTKDRSFLSGHRVAGWGGDASPILTVSLPGYTHLIVELRCQMPDGTEGSIWPPSSLGLGTADLDVPTGLGVMYRFA